MKHYLLILLILAIISVGGNCGDASSLFAQNGDELVSHPRYDTRSSREMLEKVMPQIVSDSVGMNGARYKFCNARVNKQKVPENTLYFSVSSCTQDNTHNYFLHFFIKGGNTILSAWAGSEVVFTVGKQQYKTTLFRDGEVEHDNISGYSLFLTTQLTERLIKHFKGGVKSISFTINDKPYTAQFDKDNFTEFIEKSYLLLSGNKKIK